MDIHPLASSWLTAIQWDHCVSSLLIRSGLGLGFGVIFSVLLFKRRAWPAWVGLGFGAGRAVEECDNVCSPTNKPYIPNEPETNTRIGSHSKPLRNNQEMD